MTINWLPGTPEPEIFPGHNYQTGGTPVAARHFSLQQYLTMLLVGLTLLLWTGSVTSMFLVNRHESQEIFDRSLVETAHLLATIAPLMVNDAPTAALPEKAAGVHSRSLIFQIWRADGTLAYYSNGAGQVPLGTAGIAGLQWCDRTDGRWRVYSVWDENHRYQVQVGDRWQMRAEVLDDIGLHLLAIGLLCMPLLWLGLRLLIEYSLMPIRQLAAQLTGRAAQDLTPVSTHGMPQEMLPLLHGFNALLHRMDDTLARERRFTADAAHELRTPLAAIRMHAQILRKARTPEEAQEAALDIQTGIDWATRMIEQLLTLARLDPQAAPDTGEPVRVDQAVQDVLALLLPVAQSIHIELQPVTVWAQAAGIEILLRNLLDNAARYSPPDAAITIRCHEGINQDTGYGVLEVEDQGNGIDPALYGRVFERFYRIPGTQATGSGLGLSIVQRLVTGYQGNIQLKPGSQGRGLRVRVRLVLIPLATPAQAVK